MHTYSRESFLLPSFPFLTFPTSDYNEASLLGPIICLLSQPFCLLRDCVFRMHCYTRDVHFWCMKDCSYMELTYICMLCSLSLYKNCNTFTSWTICCCVISSTKAAESVLGLTQSPHAYLQPDVHYSLFLLRSLYN